KRANLRLGSTMHFTMTDYVDNVTNNSIGNRKGNSGNDKFLYTYASLSYDLQFDKSEEIKKMDDEMKQLAFDGEDEDGDENVDTETEVIDEVNDFVDQCPHTPVGVTVDENGCPKDDDDDVVPNYIDQELDTKDSLTRFVDTVGVPMKDTALKMAYLRYIDSTGKYQNVDKIFKSKQKKTTGKIVLRKKDKEKKEKKQEKVYKVKVGENTKGISKEMREAILSIPDIKTEKRGDTVVYVAGNYKKVHEAMRRKRQIKEMGVETKVVKEGGKEISDKEKEKGKKLAEKTSEEETNTSQMNKNASGVVFRVQVGAFKTELSENIFKDVPELLKLPGNDGITRYMTGSFNTVEGAADRKMDMYLEGFKGAFIVAYKGGKRISLSEAGAIIKGEERSPEDDGVVNTLNKENLNFTILLGEFKEKVPATVVNNLLHIKSRSIRAKDGTTQYITGKFDSYSDASSRKLELMEQKGLKDIKVVGLFKGKVIPSDQVMEMKKK
ncbi:MAG: hypothetical protein ABEH43_05115, partial [Flavobacteriales bacterium]